MKKIFCFLLIFAFAAGACSCGEGKIKNSAVFYEYFDTVTEITAYGVEKEEFDTKTAEVKALLEEYHRLLDIYHSYEGMNNLHTVNGQAGKQAVKVDEKLLEVLRYGKDTYTLTDGQVNIALGAVTSLWHVSRQKGDVLPDEASLIRASKHCNIEDIIIDAEKGTVFLRDENMSVDMGALGKGYACEMAASLLESIGGEGYAINIGGNIRVTGKKTEKEYWSAGIQNPDTLSEKPYINTVYLEKYALVTSGSYMRYYTVDGVRYHHIIDPDTLYPENNFLSVSVLCGSSALGDALSTALFNMSLEEGKSLVKTLDDVYVLWVDKDGKVYYSEGFERYIKE